MKHIIFFMVFFYNINTLYSQIDKFKFDNYTPLWSHYSGSSGLSENIQALIATPYPLITTDHIYITSNIFDKTTLNGHLSEKINAHTGESIWSNYYYSTSINTREYAQSPYLDDNKYNLYIYKESRTPNIAGGIFWSKSVLMKRSYDDVTGIEQGSFVTDSLDALNTSLNIPESLVTNLKTILVKDGEYQRFIKVAPSGNNYLFTSKLLDDLGHQVDSIGYEIPRSAYVPKQIRALPTSEESNLFMIFSQNSVDSQSVQMLNLDKKLNVIHQKEIIVDLPKAYDDHFLWAVSKNGFYILSSRNVDANNWYDIVISKFNFNMELEESVRFIKTPLNIGIVELPNGTTLASFAKEENEFSNLYFYNSNGQGEINLVKKIKCSKTKDQLFVKSLYLSKDHDLLVNITHVDENSGISPVPKWNNWTLFKGEDLGIKTSNIDFKNNVQIQIIPNPTNSIFDIKTEELFDEVNILNSQGIRISRLNHGLSQINVKHLVPGFYFCELYFKGKRKGIQKFVKIE